MGVPVTLHSWTTDIGPEGNHQDITGVNNDDEWFDLMLAALTPVPLARPSVTINLPDVIKNINNPAAIRDVYEEYLERL